MYVNFVRRVPLSMLFGLTVASAGVAAPLGQLERLDDRLVLIAESKLHGIAVSGSDAAKKLGLPRSAYDDSALVPGQGPTIADRLVQLSFNADAVGIAAADNINGGFVRIGHDASNVGAGRPGGALQAWTAVPAHQLDDMRGGFDTSLNLTLSFGIERAVYLNGALVTTTSFNLPALGSLPPDGAAGPVLANGSVALVQNGGGNTFIQARDATPLAATIIQNTLNNQTLQNLTTINASSNSLQILRTNTFLSTLHEGIGQVIVPH